MTRIWSSTNIVAYANRFLDSLDFGEDEPDARRELERTIEKLSELKREMLFQGFNAPFISMLARSRSEFEGMSESDSQDLAKQLDMVREIASSKKFTLNRVRVSLTACRMALEALDDGDIDFARALPLKGDYLSALISKSDLLHPYYTIMEVLERECGKRSKIVFTISYVLDGKRTTTKVSIGKHHDIDGYVKQIYGEETKILGSRVFNVPELLVKKRSARICLAIAYSKLGYRSAMPEIHKISKSKKLKGYRDVMLSEGLNPDARIDLVEKYDGVKNTLLEMKLGTHIDGRFTLDDELSALLALKRKTTRKTSAENTKMIFAFYLFRHFILKSKRSREGSSRLPPFDKEHLSLLGDVLGILQRPPYLLNESLALVKQKIDA
ncbi:MAG: DUF530 family protein, partial [Candidatus Micrarchaeota archaeon]